METKRRSVLSASQMQVFDGLVLSDAYIKRCDKQNASFSMNVKHKSFVSQVVKVLPLDWGPMRHYSLPIDKRTGNIYTGWRIKSRSDLFLTEQRERWYPNGNKIVPRDISLSKNMVLWWYLGDGHLARKKHRPNYRRVILCTDSFTYKEIGFLMKLLRRKFGNDSIYEEAKHIVVAKKALCNFIKYIGTKSPVSAYKYKFDFGQYKNRDYWHDNWSNRSSVLDFKERMVAANSKPIRCIETNVIYPSATKAAISMGCCISSISTAAIRRKIFKGLHWEYVKGMLNG